MLELIWETSTLQRVLADYRDWRKNNLSPQYDSPPKHLVFYRDGVSEGEFEQVAQNEIPMIKSKLLPLGRILPNLLLVT